jgi:hypothetical protein
MAVNAYKQRHDNISFRIHFMILPAYTRHVTRQVRKPKSYKDRSYDYLRKEKISRITHNQSFEKKRYWYNRSEEYYEPPQFDRIITIHNEFIIPSG